MPIEMTQDVIEQKRALNKRTRAMIARGLGPAFNMVSGWEAEAAKYPKSVLDDMLQAANDMALELKDCFYKDTLDEPRIWFSRLGNVEMAEQADGMFLSADSPETGGYPVIVLNPFYFLSLDNTFSTMVAAIAHEMVHMYCRQHGIRDVYEKAQLGSEVGIAFHTGQFRKAARSHGMTCGTREDGFSDTRFTDASWKRIDRECPVTRYCLYANDKSPHTVNV